jgi:3-oxoacyl-[acyl-carrier protein] reductase
VHADAAGELAVTASPGQREAGLLAGRAAIVTGSSSGIGRAIAESFVAHGAHVVVNGVDDAMVTDVVEVLGSRAVAVAGDITSAEIPEQLVAAAVDAFGAVDIVVNNAGFCWDAPLEEMTDAQITAMLNVHVVAPLRLLRCAAPKLFRPSDQRSKVVNVSSVAATMGSPNQANYAAAKAALIGVTKALAKEWGPRGVNVNSIAPGFIETRLTAPKAQGEMIEREGHRIQLGIPEEHRRKAWDLVPLERPGTAREVAEAVLFLCCAMSDYVNGQTLSVTGGLAMGMS